MLCTLLLQDGNALTGALPQASQMPSAMEIFSAQDNQLTGVAPTLSSVPRGSQCPHAACAQPLALAAGPPGCPAPPASWPSELAQHYLSVSAASPLPLGSAGPLPDWTSIGPLREVRC